MTDVGRCAVLVERGQRWAAEFSSERMARETVGGVPSSVTRALDSGVPADEEGA